MFDIITFGSASRDIYLKSKKFLPLAGKKFITGQGICLTLGSKTEMEDVLFFSGGGGTNAAATFKNQGLKVAYCGQVGQDCFGNLIIEELKKIKIDTGFIRQTKIKPTNFSVFLFYPDADRTILVYRGASDILAKKDIPWAKIKNSRWFYLAPFAGKLTALTEDLVGFARKNKIRVALNPGYNQLTLPAKLISRILDQVDVLILNKEEASLLAKIPYQKEKEIFKKIDKLCSGIVVMTKGKDGAVVSDGKYLYRAASLGLKKADTTGAGDAFGAGFIAGLMQKDDIIFAIQLAMANSSYNITQWGAKTGLLKKGQKWPKVKVEKEPIK